MPTYSEEEVAKILGLDSWSGRTSQAPSAPTRDEISLSSLKRRSGSSSKKRPIFLSLKMDGLQPDAYQWEATDPSQWPIAYSTVSFGESPSVAAESHLSLILQADAPQKYYLSAKAADGIIRRSEKRGKELPRMLKQALLEVIEREQGQIPTR